MGLETPNYKLSTLLDRLIRHNEKYKNLDFCENFVAGLHKIWLTHILAILLSKIDVS